MWDTEEGDPLGHRQAMRRTCRGNQEASRGRRLWGAVIPVKRAPERLSPGQGCKVMGSGRAVPDVRTSTLLTMIPPAPPQARHYRRTPSSCSALQRPLLRKLDMCSISRGNAYSSVTSHRAHRRVHPSLTTEHIRRVHPSLNTEHIGECIQS